MSPPGEDLVGAGLVSSDRSRGSGLSLCLLLSPAPRDRCPGQPRAWLRLSSSVEAGPTLVARKPQTGPGELRRCSPGNFVTLLLCLCRGPSSLPAEGVTLDVTSLGREPQGGERGVSGSGWGGPGWAPAVRWWWWGCFNWEPCQMRHLFPRLPGKWAGRGGHLGKSCLIGWDKKLPPLPLPLQGVCAEAGPGAGGE